MKKHKIIAATIFILLAFVIINGVKKNQEPISKSAVGLNTVLTISVYNNEEAIDKAFQEITRLESILSVDYAGSDLDRLGSGQGNFVDISPETYFLLEESIRFARLSDGAFDVTVGPLVSLWNINSGLDVVPTQSQIDNALALINYNDIELQNGNQARLKNNGMKVNFGAIAKGYIADKVKETLVNEGVKSAIINLGGNINLIGEKPNKEPFIIGIKDPGEGKGAYMGYIKIRNKSLVTSSSDERFFVKDGVKYHHIIDPATGYPANSGLLQTTVIAEKSSDCDALSTATFILGLEKGMRLIESLPNIEAIFITENNEVYTSSGIKDFNITNNDYSNYSAK